MASSTTPAQLRQQRGAAAAESEPPAEDVTESGLQFEERFYWPQRVSKLNQCTRCVSASSASVSPRELAHGSGHHGPRHGMFILTDQRTISWPHVHALKNSRINTSAGMQEDSGADASSIDLCSYPLDNIPNSHALHSLHSICVSELFEDSADGPDVNHGPVASSKDSDASHVGWSFPQSKIQAVHDSVIYLFVCTTPKTVDLDTETGNEYYFFVYRLVDADRGEMSTLESTQDYFPLTYCPISISKASLNNATFVIVSGSDCVLHAYELDTTSGRLYRNAQTAPVLAHNKFDSSVVPNIKTNHPGYSSITNTSSPKTTTHAGIPTGHLNPYSRVQTNTLTPALAQNSYPREDIRAHWDARLQFQSANSLGICLLIEEWSGGSQGVVGHANGFLFADAFPAPKDAHTCSEHSAQVDTLPNIQGANGRYNEPDIFEFVAEANADLLSKAPISPIPRKSQQSTSRFIFDNAAASGVKPTTGAHGQLHLTSKELDESAVALIHPFGSSASTASHIPTSPLLHSSGGQLNSVSSIASSLGPPSIAAVTSSSNGNMGIASAREGRLDSPISSTHSSLNNLSHTHAAGPPTLSHLLSPPPVPRSRQCALLLEGTVTCLCFYSLKRVLFSASLCPSHALSVNGTELVDCVCSNAVCVGTTEGLAGICLLIDNSNGETCSTSGNTADSKSVLLPGSGDHGVVYSLVTADASRNGYLDVVRLLFVVLDRTMRLVFYFVVPLGMRI
jgi:hypothetical protein